MNQKIVSSLFLVVTTLISVTVVFSQHKTFLPGRLSIAKDITPLETAVFTCKPVIEFKQDDELASLVSENEAWSEKKHSVEINKRHLTYPVFGIVKASDGAFHSLIAATVTFKKEIQAGKVSNLDGFSITTSRTVKTGETIPVVWVATGVILSIEPSTVDANKKEQPSPWLKISKIGLQPKNNSIAVEMWSRISPLASR